MPSDNPLWQKIDTLGVDAMAAVTNPSRETGIPYFWIATGLMPYRGSIFVHWLKALVIKGCSFCLTHI